MCVCKKKQFVLNLDTWKPFLEKKKTNVWVIEI